MFDARLALSNSFIECYCTDAHLQICSSVILLKTFALDPQHVTMEDSYLCGYLKIKGLTEVRQTCLLWYNHTVICLLNLWYLVAGDQCMTGREINKKYFCLSESFCFCGLLVCLRYWSSAQWVTVGLDTDLYSSVVLTLIVSVFIKIQKSKSTLNSRMH